MVLRQYLAELKTIQPLAPEEELRLWRGFKDDGETDCRQRLIENYQPLVFKAAMRWRADEPTMLDIVQEGTVGLIEAVENYDHTKGVAFSLYAMHRIRGRILNFMEREGKQDWAHIDSPVGGGENADTLADYLVDAAAEVSQQAERNFLVEQVKNAMERLPEKEQMVLSGVFLEDREPKQIAQTLDMSLSHVYRLQKQGIRRIRGMLAKFIQHW